MRRLLTSRRALLIGVLLLVASAAVYWPVSTFDFTNFDDGIFVYENRIVLNGLTTEGIGWAFSSSFYDFWHPLTWCSHMLDCELFGARAGLHHLMNLFFHVANALLLFRLLY